MAPFLCNTRQVEPKSNLSRTVFVLKLKGGPDYLKGKLISFDNGVSVWEEGPEDGGSREIVYTVLETVLDGGQISGDRDLLLLRHS